MPRHSPAKAAAVAGLFLLGGCQPSPAAPPDLAFAGGWARATAPGQQTAAAYVTIVNRGGDDRLIGVSAPGVASMAMVHASSSDQGVARMRAVPRLDLPAGGTVTMKAGATHIMLMGITHPLAAGQTFALQLSFARSTPRRVPVRVRAAGDEG